MQTEVNETIKEIAGIAMISFSDKLKEVRHTGQNGYNIILNSLQVDYNDLQYLDSFPLADDYRLLRVVWVMTNGMGIQIHVAVVNREW